MEVGLGSTEEFGVVRHKNRLKEGIKTGNSGEDTYFASPRAGAANMEFALILENLCSNFGAKEEAVSSAGGAGLEGPR